MVLGPREGLAADLQLSSPSADILDFGAYDKAAFGARIPLKNHSPSPERLRLSKETGRAMLLGHRTDIQYREEKPSGGLEPQNAGGLF